MATATPHVVGNVSVPHSVVARYSNGKNWTFFTWLVIHRQVSAKSISKYITGGRVEGQKLTAEFVERSFYFLSVMPSTETTWFVRGGGRVGRGVWELSASPPSCSQSSWAKGSRDVVYYRPLQNQNCMIVSLGKYRVLQVSLSAVPLFGRWAQVLSGGETWQMDKWAAFVSEVTELCPQYRF